MNYWNRVFWCDDLFVKSFWLFADWKLLIMEAHCIFQSRTMFFLIIQKYLEIIFIYVDVYELLKYSCFLLFWCAESIYQGFLLLVVWKFSKWHLTAFFIVEPQFFWSYKVTWKSFSYMQMYINYWKRLVSNNFDVLNLIFKAVWLLIECEFFIVESHCIFHSRTIIFLLLQSYLGNYFHICGCILITESKWFPTILMCRIYISEHLGFWLSVSSS